MVVVVVVVDLPDPFLGMGSADQLRRVPVIGRFPTDGTRGLEARGCGRIWPDADCPAALAWSMAACLAFLPCKISEGNWAPLCKTCFPRVLAPFLTKKNAFGNGAKPIA